MLAGVGWQSSVKPKNQNQKNKKQKKRKSSICQIVTISHFKINQRLKRVFLVHFWKLWYVCWHVLTFNNLSFYFEIRLCYNEKEGNFFIFNGCQPIMWQHVDTMRFSRRRTFREAGLKTSSEQQVCWGQRSDWNQLREREQWFKKPLVPILVEQLWTYNTLNVGTAGNQAPLHAE